MSYQPPEFIYLMAKQSLDLHPSQGKQVEVNKQGHSMKQQFSSKASLFASNSAFQTDLKVQPQSDKAI